MPKFSITRSILVNAPAIKLHTKVRNFRSWPSWSPWLVAEPGCRLDYSEDGRSYAWEGRIVGSGEMTVIDDLPPDSIRYKLTFFKPWKAVSEVILKCEEGQEGTLVTWTMDGSLPFFMFWMKSTMISGIGMDYDRGLHMLKDLMETGLVPSSLSFPGRRLFAGCHYVGIMSTCPTKDIESHMQEDLKNLDEWMHGTDVELTGKLLSIYHKWDPNEGVATYTLAHPVASAPSAVGPGLVSGDIPPCEVYPVKHTGSYAHLANAWSAGIMHTRSKVFQQNRSVPPFEVYENDPNETPESELVTVVHFPAR